MLCCATAKVNCDLTWAKFFFQLTPFTKLQTRSAYKHLVSPNSPSPSFFLAINPHLFSSLPRNRHKLSSIPLSEKSEANTQRRAAPLPRPRLILAQRGSGSQFSIASHRSVAIQFAAHLHHGSASCTYSARVWRRRAQFRANCQSAESAQV